MMDRMIPRNVHETTDKYFTKTKNVVRKNGDSWVTYAIFMRQETVEVIGYVESILVGYTSEYKIIDGNERESGFVPAGSPMMYIEGWFSELVELETLILQRVGFQSVCAYNAYKMISALPNVKFIDMAARHLPNPETHKIATQAADLATFMGMNYFGAYGFIGSSTDEGARMLGQSKGIGTVPHALIGYAGSTLEAMKMFAEANPDDEMLVALVDYYGQEVTDTLEVVDWFFNEYKGHEQGKTLGIRLDTHGDRRMEGLDYRKSLELTSPTVKDPVVNGKGVTVAAVKHLYNQLPDYAKDEVKIIASSGFDVEKCEKFAAWDVPVDIIGTGSYIPKTMKETFATADIIKYDDRFSVKDGREWLYEGYES